MTNFNLLLFAGLGLIVGWWHFGSLRWLSQRLVSANEPPWRLLLPVHLLRIAVLVGACVWTVRFGAWPLLALAVGMVVARVVLIRQARRAEGHSAHP